MIIAIEVNALDMLGYAVLGTMALEPIAFWWVFIRRNYGAKVAYPMLVSSIAIAFACWTIFAISAVLHFGGPSVGLFWNPLLRRVLAVALFAGVAAQWWWRAGRNTPIADE